MPQVITIVLLDDNPNGIKIVELGNWLGKAFVIPRGKIKSIRDREETRRPGIYFLFGEGGDGLTIYIGQSENFLERLISHEANKEKWNVAVAFIGGLDSTQIKSLENMAITLAKKIGRYEFNQITPRANLISEAQEITIQEYFRKVKLILALLGFTLFEEVPREQQAEEVYYLEDVKNKDASAKGTLLESGDFVVYKGSKARINETKAFRKHISSSFNLRRKLIEERILKLLEGTKSYIFTKNYVFKSPSGAADVVHGRACNGWTGWKDKDGKTLDQNIRQ